MCVRACVRQGHRRYREPTQRNGANATSPLHHCHTDSTAASRARSRIPNKPHTDPHPTPHRTASSMPITYTAVQKLRVSLRASRQLGHPRVRRSAAGARALHWTFIALESATHAHAHNRKLTSWFLCRATCVRISFSVRTSGVICCTTCARWGGGRADDNGCVAGGVGEVGGRCPGVPRTGANTYTHSRRPPSPVHACS